MSRLTKEQKGVIINKVLNKTFADRQAALTEGFKTLGDSIWQSLYGKAAAALATIPTSFLSLGISVPVHFDGNGRFSYDHVSMTTDRPVPSAVARGHAAAASYEHDEPFAIEHKRLTAVKEQLGKDRELLRRNLDGLFYSINTRKQALAAWPEGEPFLPADVPVVKNLPALPTHDLNALIARMSGGEVTNG